MRSKDLFFILAQAADYCCIHQMMDRNRRLTSLEMARRLGVTKRTVQYWRSYFRNEQIIPCGRCLTRGNHNELRNVPAGAGIAAKIPPHESS